MRKYGQILPSMHPKCPLSYAPQILIVFMHKQHYVSLYIIFPPTIYIHTHTHVAMAASFCQQVRAKQLILTHFSQRYKCAGDAVGPGDESVEKLVAEARDALGSATVTASVSAAEDLKTYCIPAKK